MKISKEQLIKIHEQTKRIWEEQKPVIYWDRHSEMTQSEKLTLAWIDSIVGVLQIDLEVDYRKNNEFSSDNEY